MRDNIIQNLESFLNDFQYFKLKGFDVFQQSFEAGSKLVVSNMTPYDDGLMFEIQLGTRIEKIEECLFDFNQQHTEKLNLTYWESLSQIYSEIPKRCFIKNEVELSKVLAEIEVAMVKKGFNWLDKLQEVSELSSYIYNIIFNSSHRPSNIFKLCQRSYLIKNLLGQHLTDSNFYEYYEQMQLYKVPEHQLEEFVEFKNFLKVYLFK